MLAETWNVRSKGFLRRDCAGAAGEPGQIRRSPTGTGAIAVSSALPMPPTFWGNTLMNNHLQIVPCDLAEANAFVRQHHRHHQPVPGAKFCLAVANSINEVVGVAIVGRPVARMLDDGWTLEVNRTCTDGTRNANSTLYGACRRVAFGLGYRKLITYTLPQESGASLRAADWKCIARAGGGSWSRESRPRVDKHPMQAKLRWEVIAQSNE